MEEDVAGDPEAGIVTAAKLATTLEIFSCLCFFF